MFQVPTGIDRVTELVNPFPGLEPTAPELR